MSYSYSNSVPKLLYISSEIKAATINSGKPPPSTNFKILKGYKIEPVLWNLNLPRSIAFDDKGNMFIAESGYAPGGLLTTPRILKLNQNGTLSVLTGSKLNFPITDIEYHQGKLYVSSRAKVSSIDPTTGVVTDMISGLPSLGQGVTGQIAFGSDGRIYFGQGATTNSGVVGVDTADNGFLKIVPQLHDVPAKDIVLAGQNFKSKNPLTAEKNVTATTAAFAAFGNSTRKGE